MPQKRSKLTKAKARESKVYGLNATLALTKKRPHDVIRVYLTKARLKEFSALLKECAKRQLAYHIVADAELEKVSGSIHHEGICILAREKEFLSWQAALELLRKPGKRKNLLLLDGIENPHNIGAIARTAAYFGIEMVVTATPLALHLSGSLARTSEGASETLTFVSCDSMLRCLNDLKKLGYCLVATSPHAKTALYNLKLPPHSVFVFGAEGRGISKEVLNAADLTISVPGSGEVESLNVSSTVAICLSELFRTRAERLPAKSS